MVEKYIVQKYYVYEWFTCMNGIPVWMSYLYEWVTVWARGDDQISCLNNWKHMKYIVYYKYGQFHENGPQNTKK